MKNLLFISSRPIFPIVGGDKIRTYQSLRFLKKYFNIHIVIITPTNVSEEILSKYEEYGSCRYFRMSKTEHFFCAMKFLENSLPIQVNYYYSKKVQKYVDSIINDYDAVFCNNIRTAEYFRRYLHVNRIIDFVDAISMNYEKARLHANLLMKIIYNIDYCRCKVYESLLLQEFERASVISDIDKRYILSNSITEKEILVIGNMAEVSERVQETDAHNLIFIGKMNYAPNVLAVNNFVDKVLPLVREKLPDTIFYIVGTSPSKDVLKQHNNDSVIVTGFVDDINEYLDLASVVVAPMLSGAGIQNKIIQAMGRGKCVVTTAIGAEGLAIKDEIAIENSDRDMAEKIIFLLNRKDIRSSMGQAAKEYVMKNLSFDAISQQFHELIAPLLCVQK